MSASAPDQFQCFAPAVMIHGARVEVPGWCWVLALAKAGVPWAREAVDRERVRYAELEARGVVECRIS